MVTVYLQQLGQFYSESGRRPRCKFEDYLKIDFHDRMTFRILLYYLLRSDSNVASAGRSV